MALRFTIPGSFNNPDLPVLDIPGFTDTFTRANAAVLGTTETPARPWEVFPTSGTVQGITGGEGFVVRDGTAGHTFAVAEALASDGTLTATMGTLTGNSYGLAFRARSYDDYFRFATASITSLSLVRVAGGVTTSIQAVNAGSRNPGDVLSVILDGSSIRCFHNGVEVITATDTANQTATKHGWYSNGTTGNTVRDVKFTAA